MQLVTGEEEEERGCHSTHGAQRFNKCRRKSETFTKLLQTFKPLIRRKICSIYLEITPETSFLLLTIMLVTFALNNVLPTVVVVVITPSHVCPVPLLMAASGRRSLQTHFRSCPTHRRLKYVEVLSVGGSISTISEIVRQRGHSTTIAIIPYLRRDET